MLLSLTMNWQLLLMALGLALILEGLPYFLHPAGALRTLRQLESLGAGFIRALGFASLLLGVLILLLGRSLAA